MRLINFRHIKGGQRVLVTKWKCITCCVIVLIISLKMAELIWKYKIEKYNYADSSFKIKPIGERMA